MMLEPVTAKRRIIDGSASVSSLPTAQYRDNHSCAGVPHSRWLPSSTPCKCSTSVILFPSLGSAAFESVHHVHHVHHVHRLPLRRCAATGSRPSPQLNQRNLPQPCHGRLAPTREIVVQKEDEQPNDATVRFSTPALTARERHQHVGVPHQEMGHHSRGRN